LPAKKQMKVLVGILVSLTVLRRSFAASSKARAKRGRYALMVDGRPYLILGGQIHNSSSWPVELPQVWESMAALHANTMAAPAYWEQLEPQEGRFDFTNVGQIVEGARGHNLRAVLLRLSKTTRRRPRVHAGKLTAVEQQTADEVDAYERLLGDAMHGDAMLFVREDVVEAACAIVDPILTNTTTLHLYEPSSWGPREADCLAIDVGGWHNPEEHKESTVHVPKPA